MARTPSHFKQVDVTRAVKAASAGGMVVGRVEIDPDGRIVVAAASEAAKPQSELDRWIVRNDARQA